MSKQCPLCTSKRYHLIYNSLPMLQDLRIAQCNSCCHVYTFTLKAMNQDELYKTEQYKTIDNRKSIFHKILNNEYQNIIVKLNKLNPIKGKLLDFGCGKGQFAFLAKKSGWTVNGIETSKERATFAYEVYGIDIYDKINCDEKFEVISMLHVLEHLSNPKSILCDLVANNLIRDGLFLIEVPNFDSIQSKIAGKYWMHLDPTRHISHFTDKKLNEVSEEFGLKCIASSSFSFHLGVLGMTDSLLKALGYRGNIIYDLKSPKKLLLKISILVILPASLMLETFSALIGKGGIKRKFYKKVSK
jgi:SAM-dependent methyltransferase